METSPDQLRPCYISLRPVSPASIDYYQLRESIRQHGILTPLLTRRGNEVVDGRRRHAIALELHLPSVPVHNRDMDDFEVLVCQLLVNPSLERDAYVARVWHILRRRPLWNLNELAHALQQKPEYLIDLLHLDPTDCEELPALYCAELAKLTPEEKSEIVEIAGSGVLTRDEFLAIIRTAVRRGRQSLKDGRTRRNLENQQQILPQFRSFREVLNELKTPTAAASVLHRCGASTPLEGWQAAIKWLTKSDPATLEQRQSNLQRQQRKADAGIRKIDVNLD